MAREVTAKAAIIIQIAFVRDFIYQAFPPMHQSNLKRAHLGKLISKAVSRNEGKQFSNLVLEDWHALRFNIH
ncbi:MAG: hypothetical protein HOC20_10190 [Chloroflexi bacterium]|nr:hypothetical protein [Chloroflexota bacterium]